MEEGYNPMADMPTSDELDAQEQLELTQWLNGLWLDVSRHIDTPRWTLMQGDIGFAPLGNIMAIAAPMKSGKTWLMVQLCVAVLRGEYMGLTCPLEGEPSVLFYDTEQDEYDTMLIARRVHQLMGWDYNLPNDRFRIAPLRTQQAALRLRAIMKGIEVFHPNVVFVDGIRDLLTDFNDLAESSSLIQQFMKTTTENQCAIWSVLHTNPGTLKMRGHLGTELGNKVTDVLSVEKVEDRENDSFHFDVKHMAARHRDIRKWSFYIDDTPTYSVPKLLEEGDTPTPQFTGSKDEILEELMQNALPKGNNKTWSELARSVMDITGKSQPSAQRRIKSALDLGIIKFDKVMGKYWFNGLNEQTEEPTQQDESLPF